MSKLGTLKPTSFFLHVLFGASLSEPHTSELNSGFSGCVPLLKLITKFTATLETDKRSELATRPKMEVITFVLSLAIPT